MSDRVAIPFVHDSRYAIDRSGRVYSLRSKPGRARGIPCTPVWVPCEPLSYEKARNLARVAADFGFELLHQLSEVVIRTNPDGTRDEFERPYLAVMTATHDPKAATGESFWGGVAVIRAQGDPAQGWYRVTCTNGSVHLFHGPSVAGTVFK